MNERRWWNGCWSRLTRRDVYVRNAVDGRWQVELRRGGPDGRARSRTFGSELEAVEWIESAVIAVEPNWREVTAAKPHRRKGVAAGHDRRQVTAAGHEPRGVVAEPDRREVVAAESDRREMPSRIDSWRRRSVARKLRRVS
ncbi:hypothetical protein [Dactylosporangium sp. NPDC048998]|uniref:hypothetical protein n=1 Tax=Dactylosporangium sp. NPDC048998 TaxID=3363976 RepID=UPI00371D2694